jgi:hypothetical protein
MRAWDEELDFPALVEADGRIAGLIDLGETFDPAVYTSHVDAIFDRLHNLARNEEGVHV